MAAGEGPLPVTPSRNNLVDLARFERATSTFAESRSHSAELQVRRIGTGILCEESATRLSWHRTYPLQGLRIRTQAMAEMERFERSQDFSRHLSGVLPCQLGDISKWRKATESNRTRLLAAAVFKTV